MAAKGQNSGATNELRKITAEYKKLLDEIKKMTAQIAKMAPGGAKVDMKEQVRQAEQLRRQYEEIMSLLSVGTSELNSANHATKDWAKTLLDIKKGTKDILSLDIQIGDHTSKLTKEREGILKYLWKHRKNITTAHRDDLLALAGKIKSERSLAEVMEKRQEQINKEMTSGMKTMRDLGLEMVSSIDSAINKLPGGKYLSKLLGADKLKEQFTGAFNEGILAYIDSGGDVIKGIKGFNDALKLSKGLIAVGIAAALASAVAFLGKLEASAKELAKQTGISRDQAFALEKSIRSRSYSEANSLASNKEIANALAEQVNIFGRLGTMTATVASKTVQIGEAFGYGEQTASQVAAQLMSIGGLTAETALSAQTFGAAMAEASGVAPGKVMKDIAQNGKLLGVYMAGNAKLMMATAIEAAKLGMSISDMAKVADGLLNIESSLTAQYEAQALLGRELNFDKARQLALEGDIAGATTEILDQAGDYNDLVNMSYLQRKKVAQAAGLEVDQLMKAAKLQEITSGMSAEQQKMVEASGLSMAQLNNMSQDQILAQAASNAQVEKMESMWQEVSNTLINSVLPPVIEIVKLVSMVLGPALKIVGALISAIIWPITTALDGIKQIYNFMTGASHELGFWNTLLGSFAILWTGIVASAKVYAGWQALSAMWAQREAIFKAISTAWEKRKTAYLTVNAMLEGAKAIAQVMGMSASTLGVAAAIALTAAGAAAMFLSSQKRQMGGPVEGGVEYLVGEAGPEKLTIPAGTSGHVTSTADMRREDKTIDSKGIILAINGLRSDIRSLMERPAIAVMAEDTATKMVASAGRQNSYNNSTGLG